MRAWISLVTAMALALSPAASIAQEQEEDEEEDNSLEQSTEESSEETTDETTEETTEEPTRNTTEPTAEWWDDVTGTGSDRDRKDDEDEDDLDDVITLTGLAALVLGLSLVAIVAARNRPARTATKWDRQVLAYLRDNDARIRADLALGSGDTIHDLAAVYRVPPERHALLGDALRARHAGLVDALPADGADPFAGRAFLRAVGDVLADHPVLREDHRNWRITAGLDRPAETLTTP